MKQILYSLLILFCGILLSCNGAGTGEVSDREPDRPKRVPHKRDMFTPASSGNPYEVMVVAENSLWDGPAGRALEDILTSPIPMLPQEEPTFHVSHVSPDHYDRITNLFRNIIILKTDELATQTKTHVERNVHSDPQLILTIKGPKEEDLVPYIKSSKDLVIQYISAEEVNRYANELVFKHNIKFNEKCKEMFGCELYIPSDIKQMKVGKNFIWASNDGINTIQNVCIYSYPYFSSKVFSKKTYIALRDTFMRKNIPGAKKNQWMQTNPNFVQLKDINTRGRYVLEARGLWEMRNDAMGGPFVSHSEIDTINGRIIVVEGFVYAPSKMKRSMMRRLEAAIYTLELPTKKVDYQK